MARPPVLRSRDGFAARRDAMSHHTHAICRRPLCAARPQRRMRAGRRARLSLAVFLGLAASLLLAPAALAKFSVKVIHLGTASGAADYPFTAGDTAVEQATVDRGRYYRFDVYDPSGTAHLTTSCRTSPGNGRAAASYTLQSGDPLSNATAWRFRLREFTSSGACSSGSSALHDGSLYFDVASA